ncbi:MAG: cytochrome c biogenesis protein CcdA [Pseudomonadota bacterium]
MSADLTILGIFLAGMISFASPCVLPLVPPYLSYLAGASIDQLSGNGEAIQRGRVRRKALANAALFVAGFSVVFVSLGAGASTIGLFMRQWQNELSIVAGIIIIVMGLHFLGVLRIGLLYREARFQVSDEAAKAAGGAGAFLMGLAFAFGWTPCIGPVLGAVLGVASARDSVGEGAGMLAVYSAGLGVPFLLAALFAAPFLAALQKYRRHIGVVEKIMGVALILTGILFLTGGMQVLAFSLLEAFPVLQTLG